MELVTFPQVSFNLPAIDLTEQTTDRGRWYRTPSGQTYASVTTVLSATTPKRAALQEWRQRVGEEAAAKITRQASGEGTRLHAALERIVTNRWTAFQQANLIPNVTLLLNQMVPVLREHITAMHASEVALYSDALKLAGRTDCLCSWDGVYTILDFKRSNRPKTEAMIEDYFLQTTAYALMVEHMTGIVIPTITVVMGVADGSGPLWWHFPKDKYIQQLVCRIAAYHDLILS